ncbi:MAG: hypothetical protein HRU24_19240 [Gammaproteobacteria bacterium]|nr:hypothetical protein [Gammaproteobacteria bacterium]
MKKIVSLKRKKKYLTLFLKYKKRNLFFSIIYKKKVKFLVSSGMLGYSGKKKCSLLAMEKLIIKICSVLEEYLKFLYKKNKSKNIDIKILIVLDLYMGIYRVKKPLVLMF